jgi:hypothetical protein
VTILKFILKLFYNFGVDLRSFKFNKYTPRYFIEAWTYNHSGGSIDKLDPILYDYMKEVGHSKSYYFHQDLLVSNFIYKKNPKMSSQFYNKIISILYDYNGSHLSFAIDKIKRLLWKIEVFFFRYYR